MGNSTITIDEALTTTRTGDVWLFRGKKAADYAIHVATNSPVNHVAMTLAIDDLPPLIWHTELGQSLEDVWCGEHHRGAQLNRLTDSLRLWTGKYGQRAWVRQLDGEVTRSMEDAVLALVDEYDAKSFPRTSRLAWRWMRGRWRQAASDHVVYCAELLAVTYQRMGLLDDKRPANWYDPGRFWSGDRLPLERGYRLGGELAVTT